MEFIGGLFAFFIGIMWIIGILHIISPFLAAILATRRGRNGWNWFFLTLFYGILGLIFLACSKTINQGEYKEKDTLSKVLWTLVVIPFALFVILLIFCFTYSNDRNEEEVKPKIENVNSERIEPSNSNHPSIINPFKRKEYYVNNTTEVAADLNDFFNDESIDWNNINLTTKERIWLESKGVYYNEEKKYYVKRPTGGLYNIYYLCKDIFD